jgi:hypothetical protein
MDRYIGAHTLPRIVISDLGTNFTSALFETLMTKYGIKHHTSPSGHYQGHGKVEIQCKLVATTLRRTLENDQTQWINKLSEAVMALNNTCTTVSGLTAFEAYFGRSGTTKITLTLPDQAIVREMSDTVAKRADNSAQASALMREKTIENQRQNDRFFKNEMETKKFAVGDSALLYSATSPKKGTVDKLTHSYRQVIIDKQLPHNVYKVRDALTGIQIPYSFHANRLAADHSARTKTNGLPTDSDGGSVDRRTFSDRKQFRVHKKRLAQSQQQQPFAATRPAAAQSTDPSLSDDSQTATRGEPTAANGTARSNLPSPDAIIEATDKTIHHQPDVGTPTATPSDWQSIRRIVSRQRDSRGIYRYRVEWETNPPTYSNLYARDITKAALSAFHLRIKNRWRKQSNGR